MVAVDADAEPYGPPVEIGGKQPPHRARPGFWALSLVALVGVVASVAVAVFVGPVLISPGGVLSAIWSGLLGLPATGSAQTDQVIVWSIRMPRALLAASVGAGLATVGVAMQAAVRNSLADPYLLGTSSGASLAAVLVIAGGLNFLPPVTLSIAAFVGALGAFTLVLAIGRALGSPNPIGLVLAGVAVSYLLSGITSIVLFRSDPNAMRAVLFWEMGSFAGATWPAVWIAVFALGLGGTILLSRCWMLDGLVAGEETAASLGIEVGHLRRVLVVTTALMTGAFVAMSGPIGFIGLMVPHAARSVVGVGHRRVLILSALVGAVIAVWADLAARVLFAPEELPIGVITATCGGPAFLLLVLRSSRARWTSRS